MWAYIRVRNPLAVGAWTRVLPSRVSKPAISSGPYRDVRTPPGSVRTSRDEARDAADAAGAPQKTRSSAVAAVALHLTERHYSSRDRTRNARARTVPRTKKARRGGPFLHAPKRTRTSTRLSRTRPSTLPVKPSPGAKPCCRAILCPAGGRFGPYLTPRRVSRGVSRNW